MKPDKAWHAVNIKDIFSQLKTDEHGLSNTEAKRRLQVYGRNEIKRISRETPLKIFLEQFKSFLIIILVIATIVSALIGQTLDAAVIFAIIIFNAILGFIQDWRAEKAIEALMKMLSLKARVIRDGEEKEIDATELVPGDIIIVEAGDKIPADAVIIKETNLMVNEASLTGESVPVEKSVKTLDSSVPLAERTNMLFTGTVVTNGFAKAVVVETGMSTEIGRLAKMTQTMGVSQTPLQKRLAVLGKKLGILSLAICALVAIIGFLQGKPAFEMFMTGVSLAVAAIPEGLPAVVTISLALGVRTMARRKSIIRKLPAVETLGSTTVICTDKTGTLTKNEMTVREIFVNGKTIKVTGHGYEPYGNFSVDGKVIESGATDQALRLLLKIGLFCNHAILERRNKSGKRNAWKIIGDPTEGALVVAAAKAGIKRGKKALEPISEISFDSKRKMMTTIHINDKGGLVAYTKGAPDVLINKCTRIYKNGKEVKLTKKDVKSIVSVYQHMAGRALRVLGFAYRKIPKRTEISEKTVERDMVFVGLAGMIDPPRKEVKDAVKVCKEAKIKVIMVTGDHLLTAKSIGNEIGLRGKAITGEELDKMSDEQLEKIITDVEIFARVSPRHKLRIIQALKNRGEIVAMTGDGVNDAPALKKADIGVAMGITGTDVAKESSDVILLDDNFATIVSAVEEGRRIYDNIQKFIRYLLSSNMGEILTIFIGILLGLPLILVAVQILWMNLITDGVSALTLGMEPAAKNIMKRRPRDPHASILSRNVFFALLGLGIIIAAGTVFMFYSELSRGIALYKARTMAFTTIVMFEKFNIFNFRSFKDPLYKIGFFTNKYLIGAVLLTILMQMGVVYIPFAQMLFKTVPLSALDWVEIALTSCTVLVIGEFWKYVNYKKDSENL